MFLVINRETVFLGQAQKRRHGRQIAVTVTPFSGLLGFMFRVREAPGSNPGAPTSSEKGRMVSESFVPCALFLNKTEKHKTSEKKGFTVFSL